MNSIRQLPDSLINTIAAGEVIERPASVVKELLENSIDAGATQIEVTIEGGGIDLIRIADNGCGIAAEQLHLAIAPHATSKLPDADDLFAVRTLGFRGEALASIAEVSHLTLRSRAAGAECGAELCVRGELREEPQPCGCPVGTTVEVRNLFYSTPVRRKFLKSPQTETGHTVEAFTRVALAHPMVSMTLRSGGRVLHELPATDNWGERIYHFFGGEVADALISVSSEAEGISLHGFVVSPAVSRSNNRLQYLFLNRRYIRDRSLQHALGEAYRGLLMVGRFPLCFLHIDIAPDQVDVNVHPTKCEVRFLDGGSVYRSLLQTLRSKFLATDLTARVDHSAGAGSGELAAAGNSAAAGWSASAAAAPAPAHAFAPAGLAGGSGRYADHERELLRWARGEGNGAAAGTASLDPPPRDFLPRGGSTFPGIAPEFVPFPGGPSSYGASAASAAAEVPPAADPPQSFQPAPPASSDRSHLGFQIHNRYLITQDDSGMVVIDQHALHERIMYEQLKTRVFAKNLETQRLLIPEPVTLTAAEAALAIERREVLEQIGISVEPFGGDCVLVTGYPAMLANISPSDLLRQVLEKLAAEGAKLEARDVVDTLLHLIACKAAIKAGDRLTGEEITALLEQRYAYEDTHHCPHGRPTALHFSRQELDKMFKRT